MRKFAKTENNFQEYAWIIGGKKPMYLIEKDTPITTAFMGTVISAFKTQKLPTLNRYYNYYMGKQDIMRKQVSADWKPCNRIVSNYPAYITDSYAGYLCGIDITYSSDEDIEEIQNILNYNDVGDEDSALLKDALIFGVAYELVYIDEDGKQRFRKLDPRECIPLYYSDLDNELAAVIRWYATDNLSLSPSYFVELYTQAATFVYRSDNSLASFQLVEERPNYYHQVPVTVFTLNAEEISIFDRIMGLQDAYNTLLSSAVDDFEAFCDAYLVLEGFDTDEETVKTMKENRVLVIPQGGGATYLTKDIKTTAIENLLDRIDDKIHASSNCPDFADEAFGTASGIAMSYKLLGFENAASVIEKRMTKALQRRIELLCSILYITGGEEMWRDVQIRFTRNLPINVSETVTEINSLRGLVSDKTLLAQVPFVTDVDVELEQLKEQKEANMELYNFNYEEDEENE